ncbi:DUF871 domain-containing protein [Lacticaseibacillus absianus]|uniref:DUF871 domain-containing protein n=1 Tax=Lacticaseibacillus absianus TaxID=2729623 RepID=UPI0015C74E99|nr:MupG family TIM beta-alpha barrel fold protein [Lacticaseibacillus absianus]
MERRLGISVYPDHSDEAQNEAYLRLASQYGFSRLFMSMLEIKGDQAQVVAKYHRLITLAKTLGFEVILDVAPAIFTALGVSYDDLSFFKSLGADGIRLDEGFDGKKEALLTYNPEHLIIELNMSNDVAYLDNILSYQANKPFLYGCHNFYPQAGTGLPEDFFMQCTARFKRQNIRTAAFITSASGAIGPWNVNDGLPTLEVHRALPIEVQAKSLFATGLIDDVIIGNAYASEAELKSLSALDRYQVVFKVALQPAANPVEREIVLANQHVRRGDIAAQMIRSTETRKRYSGEANPPHDADHAFKRGDVVIGNDRFGKYKNELQVVLTPHQDARKNLVGHIDAAELGLLDFIGPWSKFKFTEG